MTRKKVGRANKYGHVIAMLDDYTLYTPARIARAARDKGFLKHEVDPERAYNRLRAAMIRFANYHQFPKGGDAMLKIFHAAACPAWFGWRWKSVLRDPAIDTK